MRIWALRVGLLLTTTVLGLELVSWAASGVLASRGVFYRPQSLEGVEEYLRRRDPRLGWPPPDSYGGERHDASGARPSPSHPDPAASGACVSTYGDSFTWSATVGPGHAWPEVLSRELGCPVANFGVQGYGSDQAHLRFVLNGADRAPTVLLAHQVENVTRNVNRMRNLYAGSRWGFKPRFLVDEAGELQLLPLPGDSAAEIARIVERPEAHLRHEYFVPGGESGIGRLAFPYTLSMLGAVRHFRVQARLAGEPGHAAFYRADHPSDALAVTAGVLEAFVREARRRGRRPLVVLIPNCRDLEHFERTGRWTHAPLREHLQAARLPFGDVGPALLEAAPEGSPEELFGECSAHPNREGYRVIGLAVRDLLARRAPELAHARAESP